jgi:hypothetical protein
LLSMISWFQIKIICRDQYKKYTYKGTIPLHMQFLRIFFKNLFDNKNGWHVH